jgi:hypothetical protein
MSEQQVVEQVLLNPDSFHNRALAAYAETIAEYETNQKARRQKEIEWAQKQLVSLGADPERMTVGDDCVIVDGWRFTGVLKEFGHELYLLGNCQKCGQEVISETIHSLDKIGEMIREFQPHWTHECKPKTTAPTLDEQVDDAYRMLSSLRIRFENAIEQVRQAKYELEAQEAYAWKNDLVQGSNDRMRKQWLVDNLHEYYLAVDNAEDAKAEAQLQYDLAKLEVDRLKLIVQLETSSRE